MKNSLHLEFRNRETRKTDPKIYNVITNTVTLNPQFAFLQYFNGIHSTIFKEVEVVPYDVIIHPDILIAASRHRDKPMTEPSFFKALVETLKTFIEKNWSPTKHHLVQHSSGWDSRIMGTIIRQIYDERGDDWLGDTSFVAWGHETDLAAKIVRAEGWNPHDFHSVPKNEDYFNFGLDFSQAWRGLNGVIGYPVNNPYWAFNMLQRRGIIPEDPSKTQVWSASWFNEMFNAIMEPSPHSFKNRFLKFYYYCANAQYGAAFDFEFVQPLFNPASIELFTRAKVFLAGSCHDARKRLVKYVNKDLIKFPRLPSEIVKVPRRFFDEIKKEYSKSWYGRLHPIDPKKTTREIRYDPWWADWSAASFCEHLLNQGADVRYN